MFLLPIPTVPAVTLCWSRCLQTIDAGRPATIALSSTESVPTPAVGFWRKQGTIGFFVEEETRPDGSREIELEIKWCDDASATQSSMAGSLTFSQFSTFARRLANAINAGWVPFMARCLRTQLVICQDRMRVLIL